ncbi:hypothetical protein A2U01_0065218, partial [Trifolium medium]|nr:hypothetical protein [Trifolium medium]
RYKTGPGSWARTQKSSWAYREREGKGLSNSTQTGSDFGKTRTNSFASGSQVGSTLSQNSTANSRASSDRRNTRGICHLPASEVNERRAKGFCFRCNERWDPLHQCASK